MPELAQLVTAGNERALARAATLVEAGTEAGRQLLKTLFPGTGKAMIVGITGPPGAGKSTLVDRLITECRARSLTVGVIAVDPSSPYSCGAILGDRVRMQRHHNDSGVFIRSMATRGQLGGLAQATLDLALLLDAAGRNVIFIETVGVGQDEIDIAKLADVTVVTLVPGMGDDVQAVKAGIMEIADVFAVNKADLPAADLLVQAIEFMQSLGQQSAPGHSAPVCKVSALEGTGIQHLFSTIESAFKLKGKRDSFTHVWEIRLREQLRETILDRVPPVVLTRHAARVAHRTEDPNSAVQSMISELWGFQTTGIEIDHLGIAVKSVRESLAFYRDVLGLQVSHQETVAVEHVTVAMLPAGEFANAPRLELLEATDSESTVAKFLAKRGPGLHHVALRVEDLFAAVARLRQSGARLLNEPRPGAGGHMYVFVHPESTGGILLELIQRKGREEVE